MNRKPLLASVFVKGAVTLDDISLIPAEAKK